MCSPLFVLEPPSVSDSVTEAIQVERGDSLWITIENTA